MKKNDHFMLIKSVVRKKAVKNGETELAHLT